MLRPHRPALRAPTGHVDRAGTETADYWLGYMDGAVRPRARRRRSSAGVDARARIRLSLPMSGLRRALLGLAVAGLAFGLSAGALVVTSDHRTDPVPFLVLGLAMGWSFIGTGLYAWWRRPDQRIGPLMTLVGFAWYAGALSFSDAPLVYSDRRAV